MTEIDNKKNSLQSTQSRRSVLTRFITTFSGGLSLNTVAHSVKGSQDQASAKLDPRNVPQGLKEGGNSTVLLEGGFLDFVPIDARVENVVQQLPGKAMHVSEVDEKELLETSNKSAVISSEPTHLVAGKPQRTFIINIFSVEEKPDVDISHWFPEDNVLERAASA